jgi:hypothetical protein
MKLQTTVNVLAEASGLDVSKWSKKKLEAEVLKITNSDPAERPWDLNDLYDAYGEQAAEMRCNDMRPPSFKKWMENKVRQHAFVQAHAARKADFESTPEGKALKEAKDASYTILIADIYDKVKPYADKEAHRKLHDANDKAYQAAFRNF